MSRARVLSVAAVGVIVLGRLLTLQQGSAPVDLVIKVTAGYEGSSVGSITMEYHWQSKELILNTEYQEIYWRHQSVSASSSPKNDVERTIAQYFTDAAAQTSVPCWMHLYDDGSWEMGFCMVVGEMSVTLTFTGVGTIVSDVAVSGDVGMIPQGLKTELQSMGISSLDVTLGWSLRISKNFLENWAANTYDVFRWIWDGITNTSSKLLGHIIF